MTHRHRSLGTLALFSAITLLAAAAPATAQSTAAEDSAHWRANKIDLDSMARDRSAPAYSKRAQSRIRLRDSLRVFNPAPRPVPLAATIIVSPSLATLKVGDSTQLTAEVRTATGIVLPKPVSWSSSVPSVASVSGTGMLVARAAGAVDVLAKADTATGVRSYRVDSSVVPPPIPVDTSAVPPIAGRATLAELPRASVDVTLPTGYTIVNVPAQAGALQAALDAAGCRTELRAAPGFSYGLLVLRVKPCTEQYHTIIRTANGQSLLPRGVRMTPALSAQRQQAQITTVNAANAPAVSADAGVRGYYFEDIAILAGGTQDVNALVKLGITQTTLAQVPGDFVFSHVYASGQPTLYLRRNFYVNSARTALVDSWCAEGHDNNSDSQCWLGLNGPGPYLIENNYMEAGHEVIMFGGGDPSIPNLVPSDITIRHNHITRPASWKGVWSVKNLLESKNARRMLVEGNVFENNWADAQVGYAILLKSVNQDGGAPWSQTTDVTVRYNLIRNTGAGINLCATCQGTVVPAARLTLYDNIVIGLNVGQFTGEAREWQFLGGLADVSVTHNTTISAVGVETAISLDGQPPKIARMDFRSNAYDNGLYGVHGGSGGSMWGYVDSTTTNWTHNVGYPPGQWAQAGFNAQGYYSGSAPTHDGRPLGANAALVYGKTAGVVVSDATRPQLRRTATAQQSGYRATSPAQRAYNTKH